jgi:hypothetical protein
MPLALTVSLVVLAAVALVAVAGYLIDKSDNDGIS